MSVSSSHEEAGNGTEKVDQRAWLVDIQQMSWQNRAHFWRWPRG